MKTAYILTCKDLKRILPLAAVWLVVIFAYLFNEASPTSSTQERLAIGLTITVYAAGMCILSLIVHDAPACGTSAFWMTRPISGAQLFINKLVVVLLVCFLMPALVLVFAKIIGLVDIPWFTVTASSHWRTLIEDVLLPLLVLVLFLMIFASLTQNLVQYFLLIFGVFAASMIFTMSLDAIRASYLDQIPQYPQYRNIQEWTGTIVLFAGPLFIIHHQYTRRNRILTALLTMLLALVMFGITEFWPTIPKP